MICQRRAQFTESATDKRMILGYLTNEPIESIAADVGLTRAAVSNRIARMRENGVHVPNRVTRRPKFFRNDYVNELNRYIRDVYRELDGANDHETTCRRCSGFDRDYLDGCGVSRHDRRAALGIDAKALPEQARAVAH